MTSRSWGIVFLKLMGLSYMLQAAIRVISMMSQISYASLEGDPNSKLLAGFDLAGIVVTVAFAAACLYLTEPLADWLFGADKTPTEAHPIPDLLRAGIGLLGIFLIATNVTTAAWFLGEALWYLEGSRQPLLRGFLGHSWRDFGSDLGALVVGAILCLRSRAITMLVWNRPERAAAKAATDTDS